LDAKGCGGWGVFIAPTTLIAVGEAVGDGRTAPPDMHCSLSGAPPRHPTVRVRSGVDRWSFVLLWHQTVRCHTGQSGAPLTFCSDFCRTLFTVAGTFAVDRWRWVAIARWLTSQSDAPPDMHCSLFGAPPRHPTVRVRSGVDRWSFVLLRQQTVRCHTEQSGAPLTSAAHCSPWQVLLQSTVGVGQPLPAGSPDSPVAHQTVR
jgi:hypothetical protein